jgi:hypothetical protein
MGRARVWIGGALLALAAACVGSPERGAPGAEDEPAGPGAAARPGPGAGREERAAGAGVSRSAWSTRDAGPPGTGGPEAGSRGPRLAPEGPGRTTSAETHPAPAQPVGVTGGALPPGSTILLSAHAHNDYRHARPLLDALELGYRSVEVDVFAVDDELLVGHERIETWLRRRMDALYLEPLAQRLRERGHVLARPLADEGGFLLLVDAKADGERVLELLEARLEPLHEHLTRFEGGALVPGELTVLLSGARPVAALRSRERRLVHLDGRPGEIGRLPAALMPLVSDRWGSHVSWRGDGPIPEEEARRLSELARRAHAAGHRLRFWGLPHDEAVWRAARTGGVDLLQSDDLARLARFLRAEGPAPGAGDARR